jgi:F-type H+-transporting ATPase subunit a
MSEKSGVIKLLTLWGIIAVFLLLNPFSGFAQHDNESHVISEKDQHEMEEADWNAGKFIIEHISDAYDWHIMDIGETHVSIPLPVILYDEGQWHFFMSSKFHHGHDAYKGYFISHHDINTGKIVRLDAEGHEVRPTLDISITKNVLAILFSSALLIFIFLSVAKSYKRRAGHSPKGLQSFLEPIILFVRDDIAKASIGKHYERYTPYLLTIFFFILVNNLLGLIPIFPGGANVTGNIGVTGVLAFFTFVITTFAGNKNYWVHIFNTPGVPWWLKYPVPLMPLVELMGVFTKPFVLMVRLFANITAGHIIILSFISLVFIFGQMSAGLGYGVSLFSIAFAIFMNFVELLVAFIQAYVFTLLSALYFGMATEEAHH